MMVLCNNCLEEGVERGQSDLILASAVLLFRQLKALVASTNNKPSVHLS